MDVQAFTKEVQVLNHQSYTKLSSALETCNVSQASSALWIHFCINQARYGGQLLRTNGHCL